MLKKIMKLWLLILLFHAPTYAQWLTKIESSDNLYTEAKREIDKGNYKKAIYLCNKAADISPKNLDIQVLLGKAFSLDGKIDSARFVLNRVLQKNPKYRDAYIFLINMEAQACNYLQAIEYADIGLKYFPNDRDILLRKLDVYVKEGDWIESNRLIDYLFERFSTDPTIRGIFLDYKLTLARQYAHKGYIEIAKRAYESVLEQDPLNKEAIEAVYNLDIRSGNFQSSLAFVNRALQADQNSVEFLKRKVAILEAMGRYAEAIEIIDKLQKLKPNDPEIRKLGSYMRMNSARYYMNTDPYLQFQAVLEKDPGNRDALNYVINLATARGQLNDALTWVNFGLKKYPNDRDLINKKLGILTGLKNYPAASKLAEITYKQSPSADNKKNFIEMKTLSAREYIIEQEYDSAIKDLKAVLYYDKGNLQATTYMVNAYNQQKRYDEAIRTLDDALTYSPGNEALLSKKAATLEAYQHYADAAQISKDLLKKYPDKRQYLLAFVEQSLAAGRQSLAYDDYNGTTNILKEVLEKQPDNLDALNYIINIESAFKQYDSALVYADQALHYYPDSRDLLFKKASVYADAHRFREAYMISGQLHNEFPYNVRFRDAYIDHRIGMGKQFMLSNQQDSAVAEYLKALEANPIDSNSLVYAINILNDQQRYDTALALIQRGRMAYPDKSYFLLKRAVVYENMQKWDDAWVTADSLMKMSNLDPKYADYANHLFVKRLKNEWGVGFLRTKLDYNPTINHLASTWYTRTYKRGTITARVNYAGRINGTGFQYEADIVYKHFKKTYSFLTGSYSGDTKIFPNYKIGYSLYQGIRKKYEAEVGIRYLKTDSSTLLSFVGGLSREFNDIWVNLRGSYINFNVADDPNNLSLKEVAKTSVYYSAILSMRYYVNPISHSDYVTAFGGYGNAPDDVSRNYQLTRVINYPTVSVGAGAVKQIKYRSTFGLFFSWYNQSVGQDVTTYNDIYHNQYDVYLLFKQKF
ncbi:MAG: YaiO family outer membrane beta-barrel protein [Chitinophagia bacterium]|nr:YaiO family outer membrane beta-barrel protein [Chitinophagia bacterium]